MAKRILKAWLKDNPLTADPNDKTAVVSPNGSLTEDDLLDQIVEEGIELRRDTLKSVITRYNNKVLDRVLSGYNVNTGLAYLRPTIKGVFYDKVWNPERHSVQVTLTPGAALREAASGVTVEILGERADLIEVYSLTDSFTGRTDGSLTRGRNAELKGAYIKIAGSHPDVGVSLKNTATGVVTRLSPADVVLNEPSRLLVFVPADIPAGEYEVAVTTQYSTGNSLLKEPRSADLGFPVTVS